MSLRFYKGEGNQTKINTISGAFRIPSACGLQMLVGLSHTCRGGDTGKPKQRLGGAGRCLGLVFVIPAAHLE